LAERQGVAALAERAEQDRVAAEKQKADDEQRKRKEPNGAHCRRRKRKRISAGKGRRGAAGLEHGVAAGYKAYDGGNWAEVVTLLVEPLQSLGAQNHPNKEAAMNLLERAKTQLKVLPAFNAQLAKANELLDQQKVDEAKAAF